MQNKKCSEQNRSEHQKYTHQKNRCAKIRKAPECSKTIQSRYLKKAQKRNTFPTFIHLLSSRLYCRLRSFTESTFRLVGCTTGRDFHPALKILFIYETSICVCQRFVKLFFAKHIKIRCPQENFSKKKNTAFLVKIHRVPFYFSVTEMLIVRDAPSSSPWKNACISPSLPTCSRKSA